MFRKKKYVDEEVPGGLSEVQKGILMVLLIAGMFIAVWKVTGYMEKREIEQQYETVVE